MTIFSPLHGGAEKYQKMKGQIKMKMKLLAGAAIAAAAMTMTGCMVTPGTIHDKSKPIAQGGYTVVGEAVTATEHQIFILGWPLSDARGSMGRRMYKNALGQAPGADALIEYTTDQTFYNFPFVQVLRYTLSGVPVKTNK